MNKNELKFLIMDVKFCGVDVCHQHTYEKFAYIPRTGDFVEINGLHYEVTGVTHYLEDLIVSGEFEGPAYVHVHIKEVPSSFYYWEKIGMAPDPPIGMEQTKMRELLIKSEIERLQKLLKDCKNY